MRSSAPAKPGKSGTPKRSSAASRKKLAKVSRSRPQLTAVSKAKPSRPAAAQPGQSQKASRRLKQAARHLADQLHASLTIERFSNKGRPSPLAGDLYVRGAAEALGITVTHMSRILTGRSRPGMELAVRIANFANCTIEDILAVSDASRRQEMRRLQRLQSAMGTLKSVA